MINIVDIRNSELALLLRFYFVVTQFILHTLYKIVFKKNSSKKINRSLILLICFYF